MPLRLIPESVIEETPAWTLAVNRNQDLLGKTMLVLRRECSAVIEMDPDEWSGQMSILMPVNPSWRDSRA